MTSIFAYPLANAWVIVGDRLETDGHETIRSRKGYEIFPSQISSKIEQQGNWVLGFAGETTEIERIKSIFYAHLNIQEEFSQIKQEIEQTIRTDVPSSVSLILFDVNNNLCYKIIISDLNSDNLEDYQVTTIENAFVGSGQRMCRGNSLLSSLIDLEAYEFKRKPDLIIRSSVSVLNNISIFDFQFTGSPYIYGCDIFIIKNRKIKKFQIIPNGYLFREENKKWKIMER